jgi:hypothetical protein
MRQGGGEVRSELNHVQMCNDDDSACSPPRFLLRSDKALNIFNSQKQKVDTKAGYDTELLPDHAFCASTKFITLSFFT